MGAKTLISPKEYLETYFPDAEPEYVRGELREKPLPDRIHGEIQAMLAQLLGQTRSGHPLKVASEVRVRTAPDVYRLADIVLFSTEQPFENVPSTPPVMVAEIVSKEDKRVELIQKLRDYSAWGVPNIWIIDPWTRRLAVWKNDAENPVETLALPEYGFEVRLEQLTHGLPI